MSEIFHSLRDLHTNYLLPGPYRGRVAFLPFLVEEFFEDGVAVPSNKGGAGCGRG